MATSVDTIEALFKSYECKLNSIMTQLEECFSSYDMLQKSIAGDSSLTANPLILMQQLEEIKNRLVRIREVYGNLKNRHGTLSKDLESQVNAIDEKISSTLTLFASKKK